MKRNEEFEQLKEEYNKMTAPADGLAKVEAAAERAKLDKKRKRHRKNMRNWGIAVAAALVLFILPNTNQDVAYAMQNIPVLGNVFRVITVRDYTMDDGHNQANVKVPKIESENTEDQTSDGAIEKINKSVEEYTDELVKQFKADMVEEGYSGLDISYEVVTDTDDWFTLSVTAVQTKASGYEFGKYYHIDKRTGQVATLKDLFQEDSDYVSRISDEIIRQMKEQMDAGESIYWLEGTEDIDESEIFHQIAEDQNFYFNKDGNIVIVFDEYEVGPGYIGRPEFVIPDSVLADIRK